jgi:small subunit ribosomal protein S16
VGTYDPLRPEVRVDQVRVKHWIDLGAQPSHTVMLLLKDEARKAAAAAGQA